MSPRYPSYSMKSGSTDELAANTKNAKSNNTLVIKGQVSASGQELHQTGICFYAPLKASKSKGTFCNLCLLLDRCRAEGCVSVG